MKWLSLVLVLVAFLAPIWGQFEDGEDFTSRYAQLASPVPAGVDINEFVARLKSPHLH